MQRLALTTAGIAIALAATASAAVGLCYGNNDGAAVISFYGGTRVAIGVRADEDFYSTSVPAGRSTAHPLQIRHWDDQTLTAGDFVGLGTYRGVGVDDCPTDTGSNWRVHVDGTQNARYFCRANYGSIGSTATNQVFKIVCGSCSGTQRWAFYVNGSTITCQAWGDPYYGYVSAGAEAVSGSGHDIRVHYDNLQTKFNSGWAYWNAGYWQSPSPCEDDPPYYVAKNSDRDFSVRTR